jgi:hypothetical protein
MGAVSPSSAISDPLGLDAIPGTASISEVDNPVTAPVTAVVAPVSQTVAAVV